MKKMHGVKSLAARAPFWLSWLKRRSYEPKILGSNPRWGIHFITLSINRRLGLIRHTASPNNDLLGGQEPAGADPELHVLHKQAVQLRLVLDVQLRVVGCGLRVHDALALGLDVVLRPEDAVQLVEGCVRHGWVWGEGVYIH
jgi:hypothetical protein